MGDKSWVVVYFNNGDRWVPALLEQALIAQYVVNCEKQKYKNLPDPVIMPRNFLLESINGANIKLLAEKYKLTHTKAYTRLFGNGSK